MSEKARDRVAKTNEGIAIVRDSILEFIQP
jgi:hypothetical protein